MKINELFGLLKKNEPEPEPRGSKEERKAMAKRLLNAYSKAYNPSSPDVEITGRIRKLLRKDRLDPLEIERNKLMRHSLIRSIVQSDKSLQQLANIIGE